VRAKLCSINTKRDALRQFSTIGLERYNKNRVSKPWKSKALFLREIQYNKKEPKVPLQVSGGPHTLWYSKAIRRGTLGSLGEILRQEDP
jgi:hypothetical protein